MNRILLCLLVLPTFAQSAPTDSLWLVGKRAPANAFGDANRAATFVRWGVTEGELPADLQGFVLERDDREVYESSARPRPTAAQVNAAYAQFPRRRALLAASLTAAGEGEFSTTVAAKLASDTSGDQYWRRLAFRLDPVLAQLGGRGFVDLEASGTYRLFAVSGERRALLGEVVVGGAVQTALPPTGVTQVIDLNRCDAPEQGRQHGVVALSWDLPGAPASADRMAHSLALAGYEIYRATEPGAPQDFARLAAAASMGPDGYPQIRGLQRINSAPISPADRPAPNANGRSVEARYKGWNPTFAQWMETAKAIADAGLKPGDQRAYYVVPRDFTGSFGTAAALVVTVPDRIAPPAPWSVHTVPIQSDTHDADVLALEWWHINPRNYYDAHSGGRTWCDLEGANETGRLRFAGKGATCAAPNGVINAAVDGYRIYRFDNQVLASRFVDTDGDGVSDAAERTPGPDGTTLPGLACDANRQPAGEPNALVASLRAADVVQRGGRSVLSFSDPVPAARRGQVYWYRIAAVGLNGQVGALSAPIRGFFPNLDKPRRATADDVLFGWCPPYLEQVEGATGPSVVDLTGRAEEAVFYCATPPQERGLSGDPAFNRFEIHRAPLVELPNGQRGVANACPHIPDGCELTVDLLDVNGAFITRTDVDHRNPEPLPNCDFGNCLCGFSVRMAQACFESLTPLTDGQTVDGPVAVIVTGVSPCVDVLRTVGDQTFRETTLCPPFGAWLSENTVLGSELSCISIQTVSDNGQSATATPLGCYRRGDIARPDPPTLTGVRFDGVDATVEWRAPAQTSSGILLEWQQDGAQDQVQAEFASHAGRYDGGQVHSTTLTLPAINDESEPQRWCFRARAFGRGSDPAGMVSDWTASQCFERAPPRFRAPSYLQWPTLPKPSAGEPLPVRYLMPDRIPVIALSDLDTSVFGENDGCFVGPFLVECEDETSCVDDVARVQAFPECDLCERVERRLENNRRFVVYRQRRLDGAIEPYHQVSSRIDGMFCNKTCADPFGCAEDGPDPHGFCFARDLTDAACGNDSGTVPQGFFDPYIKLLNFPEGDAWPRTVMAFADRSPHATGADYRYQLVYFDTRGEVASRRTTPWLEIPVEGAL